MFFSLIIYVAYEHAKRRGITALATACDRSDPGRAYSCARSEIRWQNRINMKKCYPLFINIIY